MKREAGSSEESTREQSPSPSRSETTCAPERPRRERQSNLVVRKDKKVFTPRATQS